MLFEEKMKKTGLLPAVELEEEEKAVPLARALLTGGMDIMEITFRTAAASRAIQLVNEYCPEMLIGAGTVINVKQARQALESGAQFVVCPGFSREVVDFCREAQTPVIPACTTGTEILWALDKGLDTIKFFPAEASGGIKTIKALHGPFPAVRFLPTGGIGAANMKDYLALPYVVAVGGTWMTPKDALSQGDFARISTLCREALATMHIVRGN